LIAASLTVTDDGVADGDAELEQAAATKINGPSPNTFVRRRLLIRAR
jgi:hypothetical protein